LPPSPLAQMARNDGEIDLYLARFRVLPFQTDEGPVEGCVVALEPLPQSRHVTRRPWHTHRVVAAFKRPPEALRGVCVWGGGGWVGCGCVFLLFLGGLWRMGWEPEGSMGPSSLHAQLIK
jgi:hypothetical protein